MCARRLLSLIIQGRNLVWIDESGFETDVGVKDYRSWSQKGEPMKLIQHKVNDSTSRTRVTLYAAIGAGLHENQVFMTADGCSSDNFVDFIKKVNEARRDPEQELIVCLDNATIHHSV